ncbi:winged helix-turn-helix domain-containing protein [Kitasatospora sp. GP82]|uniref:winged helix-turn-helix domain-containing protein n=1 Tax=Kitasatospora sp. GP82 TaxID=3035089 RepID=UPI00247ECECF|nr:DNA-binding response OmpR family regulator [Kitasatospora sp. GP82]
MVVRYPRLNVIFSDRHTAPPALHRVEAPTAHARGGAAAPPHLLVDHSFRVASVDGRELELTYLEFELLAHLVAHPMQVHSRRRLMEAVWERPDNGDTRTISTHIARLRRKLGPGHRASIATVRQIGYKYDPRLAVAA